MMCKALTLALLCALASQLEAENPVIAATCGTNVTDITLNTNASVYDLYDTGFVVNVYGCNETLMVVPSVDFGGGQRLHYYTITRGKCADSMHMSQIFAATSASPAIYVMRLHFYAQNATVTCDDTPQGLVCNYTLAPGPILNFTVDCNFIGGHSFGWDHQSSAGGGYDPDFPGVVPLPNEYVDMDVLFATGDPLTTAAVPIGTPLQLWTKLKRKPAKPGQHTVYSAVKPDYCYFGNVANPNDKLFFVNKGCPIQGYFDYLTNVLKSHARANASAYNVDFFSFSWNSAGGSDIEIICYMVLCPQPNSKYCADADKCWGAPKAHDEADSAYEAEPLRIRVRRSVSAGGPYGSNYNITQARAQLQVQGSGSGLQLAIGSVVLYVMLSVVLLAVLACLCVAAICACSWMGHRYRRHRYGKTVVPMKH